MNLALLREAVGLTYPEEFADVLDYSSGTSSVCCQFNRYGTLLAAGYNDGSVVVWDFLTRGVVKVLTRPEAPITIICSVTWSRKGRTLVTAATDNNVCVWDVLSGRCARVLRFPCAVLKVQYHPRHDQHFLVTLHKNAPVLMSTDGTATELAVEPGSDLNIVAAYDRKGEHVYMANGKGRVWVVNTGDNTILASFKATPSTGNSAAIKSLDFPRRDDYFITNTADRILRIYTMAEVLACGKNGEPEPEGKLQDMVNKTQWKKCCFSGDGKYICAASTRQHALFIFERCTGTMVKILHGTKGEILLDLAWHPVLPVIASVANGVISLCTPKQKENWSAFAPDFKEIEENIEYEEVEGEFDIEDEDKSVDNSNGMDSEDVDLDVTSVVPVVEFISSDEEGEDVEAVRSLPISPDPDDLVACAAGGAGDGAAGLIPPSGATSADTATDTLTSSSAAQPIGKLTISLGGGSATAAGKAAAVSPAVGGKGAISPAVGGRSTISPGAGGKGMAAVVAVSPSTPMPQTVVLGNVMNADDVHPLLGGSRRSSSATSGGGVTGQSAGLHPPAHPPPAHHSKRGGSASSGGSQPGGLATAHSGKPGPGGHSHTLAGSHHTETGSAGTTTGKRAAAGRKDSATSKPAAKKKRTKEPKWK